MASLFSRIILRAALLGAASLVPAAGLSGCAKAGRTAGPVFESPGAFRIGLPGPGWKMVRNRRVGSRLLVDFARPGEDVHLRVTVHPLDEKTRHLPLPTLAEALVRNYGSRREIVTEIDGMQRVDYDRHEGFVVYATRRWSGDPATRRRMAQAFVRAGDHLVMLSYIAPTAVYDTYAADYARAVDRFDVLFPPDLPRHGLVLPSDLPRREGEDGETLEKGPLPVTTPPPPDDRKP